MKVAEKYWRSISNNINQIAHRVNTKQQADITDLNDIRDQLLSIQRQINDIQYHNDMMILQQKQPARERK
ncbi:plasmid mobilization relaxosome protein MobC [Scardovia wiggsiae]|uniref:plasmid mobilization relaxosome protein MobC n=1 Tax=Scardovia wiggsiae TaxID=230143 RepID=UPI003BAD8227